MQYAKAFASQTDFLARIKHFYMMTLPVAMTLFTLLILLVDPAYFREKAETKNCLKKNLDKEPVQFSKIPRSTI
jgi:heme exporter protein D